MTRSLSALAVAVAAMVASGVLAGCSTSPGSSPLPTPRPDPARRTSPSAAPSLPTTTTLTLGVVALPTTFGVPGAPNSYPATIRASVPPSLSGEVAAYGVAGTVVVAPAGWTGSGEVGADGSVVFTLLPTGASPGDGAEMVYQFDGACAGCTWGDASAFFPAVADALPSSGLGPASSPAAGLQTELLAPGLIGYRLPDAQPGLEMNGVAYTNLPASTDTPIFENLLVTLPAAEHPLATAILNALVSNQDRYVCASGAPSSSISLTLMGGTC
jgi:hypothetical protein